MTDLHYQKIRAGLERLENRDAFEKCARDLLREAYPSLAAVHGGSDAGMDGAIADGEGDAYPLVATTAKDVARNLRKNLDSQPEAIAEASFTDSGAICGLGSEHWEKWQTAFRTLLETVPEHLQEVARCGLEIAEARISQAEEWKRRFELTGQMLPSFLP